MEANWSLGATEPYRLPNYRLSEPFPIGFITVSADGSWFETQGTARCDLSTRHPLRRILRYIALQSSVGEGTTLREIIEAGWPGERILPTAAATRAHTAVYQLRGMGLRGWLVRRRDGYVLRPTPRIEG